mmetsp:Transcript_27579/g.67083  ORF Transcript_27579/g.67083 Transcript_27579/m.67083 type:complete len:223 (+) Transcript_27579:548-1216(+)
MPIPELECSDVTAPIPIELVTAFRLLNPEENNLLLSLCKGRPEFEPSDPQYPMNSVASFCCPDLNANGNSLLRSSCVSTPWIDLSEFPTFFFSPALNADENNLLLSSKKANPIDLESSCTLPLILNAGGKGLPPPSNTPKPTESEFSGPLRASLDRDEFSRIPPADKFKTLALGMFSCEKSVGEALDPSMYVSLEVILLNLPSTLSETEVFPCFAFLGGILR